MTRIPHGSSAKSGLMLSGASLGCLAAISAACKSTTASIGLAIKSIVVQLAWLAIVLQMNGFVAQGNLRADDTEAVFEKHVRPVLAGLCFKCHGGNEPAGELRVDSRMALLEGGESGTAIVPGDPKKSLLIQAIMRTDEDVSVMPPDKDKALRPDQIEAFVHWVRAGAVWPEKSAPFVASKHWSFEPVRDVLPPEVKDRSWVKTPLDAFIRARQEAAHTTPAPKASKLVLIRRATFDLTGLPPTRGEVDAYLSDDSPQAFAAVVDRLLMSPHYGEQMGRHWLDVVRYADTAGENSDHPLPHAWRYRNWVIASFNDNRPFDEFIRHQIAGDLLAAEGPAVDYSNRIIATGFLAIARRFGHDIEKEKNMVLTLDDTIDTLGKSILGLTIACARCHDHKYDPLSSRDYYGLYGILQSTTFSFPGCEPKQQPRDLVPLVSPEEYAHTIQLTKDRAAVADAKIQQLLDQIVGPARRLKAQATKNVTVLSSGQIEDGGSKDFAAQASEKDKSLIRVSRGDVIQLSISPKSSHGGDTTLVDFTISQVGGKQRRWSVSDLVDDLLAGNPHADKYGNTDTWCFFDTRDGFMPLTESLDAMGGKRTLNAWQNGVTPSIFVNASSEPVKVWTTLPPKSFFMHPGEHGAVAIAWLCPLDGTVKISGKVTDVHPIGSDGVGYRLEQFHSPMATDKAPDLASMFSRPSKLRLSLLRAKQDRRALDMQPPMPMAYGVKEGTPQDARIHKRGDPTDLGDEVPRKFLEVLGGQRLANGKASGRKELAEWLTEPKNPLTARVFVNRIWLGHFGRGLVTTPNNFGSRGTAPTHPELLDYLSSEFVRSGWDIKAMHRHIMLSATYQLSSRFTKSQASREKATPLQNDTTKNDTTQNETDQKETAATEPDNISGDLYTVFRRRRLRAEELRDALLSASGELDRIPGRGHPFPAESTWSFTQHGPFAAEYDTFKRSVYMMQKRNRRTRFSILFDGPDPNASTPVRDVTTVPTQALFFLNDPFLHARAERLSANLMGLSDDGQRLDRVYRQVFGRRPTKGEMADAADFIQANSWPAYCRVLLSSNEFLYVD